LNTRLFYAILFLIFVSLTSVCSSQISTTQEIPANEVEIKNVVYDYFSAIRNQNWSKAKDCCVYKSDRYYKTVMLEDRIKTLYQHCNSVYIFCAIIISNVNITDNNATVKGSGTMIISTGDGAESESSSSVFLLQKTGDSWKIYSSYLIQES